MGHKVLKMSDKQSRRVGAVVVPPPAAAWSFLMSYLFVSPESVAAAAEKLTSLQSAINAANAAAAKSTSELLAAGADEISTQIAALFGAHGLEYQAVSTQVAAFNEDFL